MINLNTAKYSALLLRVSLGVMFLAHAALKVFVFTIPGFVGYFQSLGLPAVFAYGTLALEVFGALALILGVYAPWLPCRWLPKCSVLLCWCMPRLAGCSPIKAVAGNIPRSGWWACWHCS